MLISDEINIEDNLMTNEIEALLRRWADRIRVAAFEVQNIYLGPHSAPKGSGLAHRAPQAERVGDGE